MRGRAERDTLLSLKKAEYEKGGKHFDEKLNAWDLRFYMTKMMKREYDVDEQLIQQYLPLTAVLDGLCALYQQVLGIRYERIEKVFFNLCFNVLISD